MLLVHARRFSIESVSPSKFPRGISPIKGTLTPEEKRDPVVAFICVEREDGEAEIDEAVPLLLEHCKVVAARELLLIPFAHLSQRLKEPPMAAHAILSEMSARMASCATVQTSIGDFGYHNLVFLETRSHPLSFVFREVARGSQCRIDRKGSRD